MLCESVVKNLTTHLNFTSQCGITWRFEHDDRAVDVHQRNGRNRAQLGAQRLGHGSNDIAVLI